MRKITVKSIETFREYLKNEEKSEVTIEKYIRDVKGFVLWLGDKIIEKSTMLMYKEQLVENYAPASVNSILSSLNSLLVPEIGASIVMICVIIWAIKLMIRGFR